MRHRRVLSEFTDVGLGSLRVLQEALIGRSVRRQCDASVESSPLQVEQQQSIGHAALRYNRQPSNQYGPVSIGVAHHGRVSGLLGLGLL